MYIDRKEVYRYLGIRNGKADAGTVELVEQCIGELDGIEGSRYCSRIYRVQKTDNGILIPECGLLLEGVDMLKLLGYSDYCAVMAATLGIEVDRRIAYYSKTQLTKGLVLDACATAAVEALCDEAEEAIRQRAKEDGFLITRRFSPGYGDFSITVQQSLLDILDAYRQIGLTVTDSCILVPRKSVTAVIGLYHEEKAVGEEYSRQRCADKGCPACGIKNCKYRKGGDRHDSENT